MPSIQKCWQTKWNIKKDSRERGNGKINTITQTIDPAEQIDWHSGFAGGLGLELSKIQRNTAYRAGISSDERAAAYGLSGHKKGKRYGN